MRTRFARASFLCLLIKDTGKDKLSVKISKEKRGKTTEPEMRRWYNRKRYRDRISYVVKQK